MQISRLKTELVGVTCISTCLYLMIPLYLRALEGFCSSIPTMGYRGCLHYGTDSSMGVTSPNAVQVAS